jgi:integrase
MAEGVIKRHSTACAARDGKRCRCNAGWEAWVYLSREKRKTRKTFKTKSEAKSWRTDALRAAALGALRQAPKDSRTVAEGLADLIAGMQAGTIRPKGSEKPYKPNTIRSYERALRLHIAPSEVGRLKVTDVRRLDVQELSDELLVRLNPKSVSNVLNPLQTLYRRAVDREELAFDPTDGIDLPTGKSKRPRRIVTPEQAETMITALPEDDQAIWATAFYAGLRRGELQAFRVIDIDLETDELQVEKGWDQEEGEIEPKSEAGERAIPLLAVLRGYIVARLMRNGRSGKDLVFGRAATEPFCPSTIGNRAKRAWEAVNEAEREAAGAEGREPVLLPVITLHEARHTFASMLIDTGANPKAVQEVMGHSKIQTTFDVYGHLFPGSRDDVRARMDAYLAARSRFTGAQTGASPADRSPVPVAVAA